MSSLIMWEVQVWTLVALGRVSGVNFARRSSAWSHSAVGTLNNKLLMLSESQKVTSNIFPLINALFLIVVPSRPSAAGTWDENSIVTPSWGCWNCPWCPGTSSKNHQLVSVLTWVRFSVYSYLFTIPAPSPYQLQTSSQQKCLIFFLRNLNKFQCLRLLLGWHLYNYCPFLIAEINCETMLYTHLLIQRPWVLNNNWF